MTLEQHIKLVESQIEETKQERKKIQANIKRLKKQIQQLKNNPEKIKKTYSVKDPTREFEVNSVYEMRYIGDSDLRVEYIVIKRTAKTITFDRFKHPLLERFSRRVRLDSEGREYIVDGSYSMAPSISAKNISG